MRSADPARAGADNYWVTLDDAARLLGVTRRAAENLARRDHWRRHRLKIPSGRNRTEYLFADIKATRDRRKRTR
ncbi:MAG TPA: hypothetical protein VGC45_15680 [Gryllotalpicola sp.]